MTKRDFIALADAIRNLNEYNPEHAFDWMQIQALADFCQLQNTLFNRDRWLGYIAGKCGPNGGAIRKDRAA